MKKKRSITSDKILIVQLSADGRLPYEEEQAGDILATFSDNVFGSWIRMRSLGNYTSELVEFSFANDFKNLTLTLKDGVKFHNDRIIAASDIEFSILRGLHFPRHSFYAGFLGCINGIDESTHLTGSEGVAGVRVINSKTIELSFKRSCYEFIHALTLPYLAPRPKEELLSDLIHFRSLPVGAGSYQVIEENVDEGTILLKKVDSSSGPEEILILVKQKSIKPDVFSSKVLSAANPNYKATYSSAPSSTMVLFSSNSHPIFDADPNIRSLVNKALDRSTFILNDSEKPAFNLLVTGAEHAISDSERHAARLELKRIFSQLKQPITIAAFGSQEDLRKRKALECFAQQFSELGLSTQFEFLDSKFLTSDDGRRYAFWLANLVIDPLSPGTMLSSFRNTSAFEFHKVDSPILEQLFVSLELSDSAESRAEFAKRLDLFISQNGFGIPILRFYNSIYFNPDRVTSLGDQNQILSIEFNQIKSNL